MVVRASAVGVEGWLYQLHLSSGVNDCADHRGHVLDRAVLLRVVELGSVWDKHCQRGSRLWLKLQTR